MGVALYKMASTEKVVKYRWWPRNGCDGRSVTKNNSVTSLAIGTKFT